MDNMDNNNFLDPAQLTGDATRILHPDLEDSLFFDLQKGDTHFTMGLSDILFCLRYAEEQGEVPELPRIWWCKIAAAYPKIQEIFP